MKPFKFKIVKRALKVDLPSYTTNEAETEPEQLTGTVQGMKASAPEERMAKALDKAGIQYLFRYTVGAPRGLPGWKELDFLVSSGGQLQAVEVDTAFTHRNKQQSDVLHDAIILNDPDIKAMGEVYPRVTHVDGDSDLTDQQHADSYVKKSFTRGDSTIGRANEFQTPYEPVVVQENPQQTPLSVVPQITKKKVKQIVNRNVTPTRKVDRKVR